MKSSVPAVPVINLIETVWYPMQVKCCVLNVMQLFATRWRCKPDILEDKSDNLSLMFVCFVFLKHIIVSYIEGERMRSRIQTMEMRRL